MPNLIQTTLLLWLQRNKEKKLQLPRKNLIAKMTMIETTALSDEEFDIVNPMEAGPVSPLFEETAVTQSPSHKHSPPVFTRPLQKAEDLTLASQKSLHGLLASDEIEAKNGGYFGDRLSKLSNTLMSHIDWSNKVVLIAVMGMTGSGKTTFISKATGRDDLRIGHDLTSCTQEIQVIETKIDDHIVRFVDTPGFSDTYLSDTEVLEMIADYLGAAYTKDVKLSGIIYLHPISDNRITHHATKNLDMFRKLTGEDNLKNVVLVTTMWDTVTPEKGAMREQELKLKFWSLLLAFNAKTARHSGSTRSAQDIARGLLKNKPFYLQLQQEMGKDNKALKDTAAGREIMAEIERIKEMHQRDLDAMKEIIAKTSAEQNRAALLALEESYKEMLRDIERTHADERRMNEDAVKSLKDRIYALENRSGCSMM